MKKIIFTCSIIFCSFMNMSAQFTEFGYAELNLGMTLEKFKQIPQFNKVKLDESGSANIVVDGVKLNVTFMEMHDELTDSSILKLFKI